MKKLLTATLVGATLTTVSMAQTEDIKLLQEQIQELVDEIEKLKEQTAIPGSIYRWIW